MNLGYGFLKIIFRIGLLLLQVHQELCEDNHVFDKPFEAIIWNLWMDEICNEAFETSKDILVKTHVLKLPNFDKDFEIHFDASWCTPKLLDGLNYKPNGEDNGRKRSWGTLTSS